MGEWWRAVSVVCVLAASAVCPAPIVGASLPVATGAAAELPSGLPTLEQKMGELKISSLRFSLQKSVSVPPGDRELQRLFKLLGLDSRTSGEATTTPAAANVSLGFFGQTLSTRSVGNTVYLYFAKLAHYDHGRPWVRLGRGGLAELLRAHGHSRLPGAKTTEPKPAEPKLAEPPFAALASTLAGAREVHELGLETVDGQSVTSFLAILEPAQLKSKSLASTSSLLPAAQPPSATLE